MKLTIPPDKLALAEHIMVETALEYIYLRGELRLNIAASIDRFCRGFTNIDGRKIERLVGERLAWLDDHPDGPLVHVKQPNPNPPQGNVVSTCDKVWIDVAYVRPPDGEEPFRYAHVPPPRGLS